MPPGVACMKPRQITWHDPPAWVVEMPKIEGLWPALDEPRRPRLRHRRERAPRESGEANFAARVDGGGDTGLAEQADRRNQVAASVIHPGGIGCVCGTIAVVVAAIDRVSVPRGFTLTYVFCSRFACHRGVTGRTVRFHCKDRQGRKPKREQEDNQHRKPVRRACSFYPVLAHDLKRAGRVVYSTCPTLHSMAMPLQLRRSEDYLLRKRPQPYPVGSTATLVARRDP